MNATNSHFEAVLSHHGFARRPEQDELVRLLYNRSARELSFVQAGTGVGKSYALIADAIRCARERTLPSVIVTPTNKLTEQYIRSDLPSVREAIPDLVYTRVMGSSHYVCADSDKAPSGIQGSGQISDEELRQERDEWLQSMTQERAAWQNTDTPDLVWATEFERAPSRLPAGFACPGYPYCQGTNLGGCGAKAARARARTAEVVITNGHVLAIAQMGVPLLPPARAVTHVDEAHTLPSTIRDCRTRKLDRSTGSHVFTPVDSGAPDASRVHALRDAVHAAITHTLRSVRWENAWQTDALAAQIGGPRNRPLVEEIEWFRDSPHYLSTRDVLPGDEGNRVVDTLLLALKRDRGWAPIVTKDSPGTIQLVPLTAAEQSLSTIDGAAVSATIPESLPAMYGHHKSEIHDVGHPFDYRTNVSGFISQHPGVKSGSRAWYRDTYLPRKEERLTELSYHLGHEPSLVLCSSHADVRQVAEGLKERGHTVYRPEEGGSGAANTEEKRFRQAVQDQAPGAHVLVGTDTYATGMDLPGDLLTRVAWWTVPYGATTELDKRIDRKYRGARRDWLRVKVAQGCGRLLRAHTDTGSIILMDERFASDYGIQKPQSVTDRHLADIEWEWID